MTHFQAMVAHHLTVGPASIRGDWWCCRANERDVTEMRILPYSYGPTPEAAIEAAVAALNSASAA